MKPTRILLCTGILSLAWASSIAVGMHLFGGAENAAGTVPVRFPAASALALAKDGPTLVVMASATCPNTHATLGELTQVVSELHGTLKTYVLFAPSQGGDAKWNDTGAWGAAAGIPGVVPVGDNDGTETRRFGATTSGHALLFGSNGRLLFSVGLAEARNRANGASAIVALVQDAGATRGTAPAFGCSLFETGASEMRTVAAR